MPFRIIRNDITKTDAEAIVNAANTSLLPGGGVCGAIFAAAGYKKLEAACRKIGHCDVGSAVITKGYNLKAKYIIHTPGPVYRDGNHNEEALLYSCYKSSLELAKSKNISSIAFPLISSGIYSYPKAEALKTATKAISDFLENNEMRVYLVVYDKQSFEISSELYSEVEEYIDRNFVKPDHNRRIVCDVGASMDIEQSNIKRYTAKKSNTPKRSSAQYKKDLFEEIKNIDDMFREMDMSFSVYLLKLITDSGMTDVEVYKRANVDRKLFSKIRSNREYKPSKTTAVAFAIALRLDMDGAKDLIGRAGYALTRSSKFDIVIEYFITHGNYNIFEINEVLFSFDLPLIGA